MLLDIAGRVAHATLSALNLSQAIVEFGPDGTILTANSNFLAVMGYELAELQGRNHSTFLSPAERETTFG